MFRYRIFFKKQEDGANKKTYKYIEIEKENFDLAVEEGRKIAKEEELRIVMIAELSNLFK
jgi:hypothetical protein